MTFLRSVGAMTLLALVALPTLAQQTDPAAVPPVSTPPAPQAPIATLPGGVVATTNNPNLAVAAVKLENGVRVSKVVGAAVYSDQNERIGTVDDLVMTDGKTVTVVVISVGGFLGLGSKLVVMPYEKLKRDGDRVMLPGATKDALNAMPNFVY